MMDANWSPKNVLTDVILHLIFGEFVGDLHILGGGAIVKEFLIFCLYQEDIQRNPVFKCHLSLTGFLSLSSKPRLPNTYHKQVSYVILFV